MNREAQRALRRVHNAWTTALHNMSQMGQSTDVRPKNPQDVFQFDSTTNTDEVKLNVGPVVFNVPERPGRRDANLFIVVKGWLSFEDGNDQPLRTRNFGTEIGYFRAKSGTLEHILGVHYDMDEEKPGHPVFHAQLSSQHEFGGSVSSIFRIDGEVTDRMEKIIRNVRIPSAQMDVFSVITQICADHLMGEGVADEVRIAFKSLRSSCDFLVGAAHRLDYLNTPPATGCYRSTHWYASPAANASQAGVLRRA